MVIHDLKHPIESAIGQLGLLEKNVKDLREKIKQNSLTLQKISSELTILTGISNQNVENNKIR